MASGGTGTDLAKSLSGDGGTPQNSPQLSESVKPEAAKDLEGQSKEGPKICQFFQMGKCHFGHKCRSSHSEPLLRDPEGVSPEADEKQDEEKMEKQKKAKGNVNKGEKLKMNKQVEINKKPRMRTADDVISRILWDPSVDASEFVVGYVDRFLGVLERPFCDFNWDVNPCDCDYSAELALPRHRIQYFTYRGHRVWDRHSRTDRVFGSTGQSLAPPFGREEEVNERAESQTELQECFKTEQKENGRKTDDDASAESQRLEEDKLNTSTSTFSCGERSSFQEHKESLEKFAVDDAAHRLQMTFLEEDHREKISAKAEVKQETSADRDQSWESKVDSQTCFGATHTNQDVSAPLEQTEEKSGGRPPKRRPTHFICFRANTPAVLSSFQSLQEELITLLPASAPHWQNPSRLHVTMCLLVLHGPAEVEAAKEILRRFAHLDRNPPVAVTFPVKLKHFNGKVLYLGPQPQIVLQQLNSGLQEAFRDKGWLHRSSYNPRYHLTLAKVEDVDGERMFESVGDLKVGKGFNFGRLPVNTLHLCAVSSSGVDDFYDVLCTVTLR